MPPTYVLPQREQQRVVAPQACRNTHWQLRWEAPTPPVVAAAAPAAVDAVAVDPPTTAAVAVSSPPVLQEQQAQEEAAEVAAPEPTPALSSLTLTADVQSSRRSRGQLYQSEAHRIVANRPIPGGTSRSSASAYGRQQQARTRSSIASVGGGRMQPLRLAISAYGDDDDDEA